MGPTDGGLYPLVSVSSPHPFRLALLLFVGHAEFIPYRLNIFLYMIASIIGTVAHPCSHWTISAKWLKEGLLKTASIWRMRASSNVRKVINDKYSVNIPMPTIGKGKFRKGGH
jgi:hypothetical protein